MTRVALRHGEVTAVGVADYADRSSNRSGLTKGKGQRLQFSVLETKDGDVIGLARGKDFGYCVGFARQVHGPESGSVLLLDHMVISGDDSVGTDGESRSRSNVPSRALVALVDSADHENGGLAPAIEFMRRKFARLFGRGIYFGLFTAQLPVQLFQRGSILALDQTFQTFLKTSLQANGKDAPSIICFSFVKYGTSQFKSSPYNTQSMKVTAFLNRLKKRFRRQDGPAKNPLSFGDGRTERWFRATANGNGQ